MTPLALAFDSELLGTAAVAIGFRLAGFSVWCRGLCYFLGFDSERTLEKASAVSLAAIGGVVLARAAGLEGAMLGPFRPALSVLGPMVHFISLLIASTWGYARQRSKPRSSVPAAGFYAARNVQMVLALCAALGAGTWLELPGLTNNALVFGTAYTLAKLNDLVQHLKLSGWLVVMATSLTLWRGSLWAHEHPGLLASLLTRSA